LAIISIFSIGLGGRILLDGDQEKTVGSETFVPYISRVRKDRAKYRRRRLGALFVAAALGVALYTGGGAGAESQAVHYTVAPGDTLWGIAIEHTAPWEDPRPKVEAIREANDLSGYEIFPGMSLELPPSV
jgi:LysM repeat protein